MKTKTLFEMATSLGLGKKFVPMQMKSFHPRETATRQYIENWHALVGIEITYNEIGLVNSFTINGTKYPVQSACNVPMKVYVESYSNRVVFEGITTVFPEFPFPMTQEKMAGEIEKQIVHLYSQK